MKLNNLIEKLQVLQSQGHGEAAVFYRRTSSGDCGLVSSVSVTDEVDDDTGPFDISLGEQYVSLYV